MTDTKIRFATLDDLPDLVVMQVEFEKYFQELSDEFYDINTKTREKDIYDLNFSPNPLLRTLIAEVENGTAGRVSFYRGYAADTPPMYVFHLSGIIVKKEFRGQKIAEKLFEELIKIAKAENVHKINWTVWGKNDPAIKFYKNIGGKFRAEEDNEHLMCLDIE